MELNMKKLKQTLIIGVSLAVIAGASYVGLFLIKKFVNLHVGFGLDALNSGQVGLIELFNIFLWMLYPFVMMLIGIMFAVSFLRNSIVYFLWERL